MIHRIHEKPLLIFTDLLGTQLSNSQFEKDEGARHGGTPLIPALVSRAGGSASLD